MPPSSQADLAVTNPLALTRSAVRDPAPALAPVSVVVVASPIWQTPSLAEIATASTIPRALHSLALAVTTAAPASLETVILPLPASYLGIQRLLTG